MQLSAIKIGALMVVVAGLLGLAGCGDDDSSSTASTSSTESTDTTASGGGGGSGETVDISETEFAIDPSDVKTKAGTVTFDVSNDGEIPHTLEIEGNGVEEELEPDLAGGESGTLEVDLKAGDYEMYCPIANHREEGMEGTITVQ